PLGQRLRPRQRSVVAKERQQRGLGLAAVPSISVWQGGVGGRASRPAPDRAEIVTEPLPHLGRRCGIVGIPPLPGRRGPTAGANESAPAVSLLFGMKRGSGAMPDPLNTTFTVAGYAGDGRPGRGATARSARSPGR